MNSVAQQEERCTLDTKPYGNEEHLLPPADLAGEMEQLREDLSAERDRHLRTLADFRNYRRRIERDGNILAEEGKRRIILALLDILDDMEKAIQSASNDAQPFEQGLRIIHQKTLALLKTHGVLPFESVGTPFNPHLHEAVALVGHEGSEPGIVVDELRRGYHWNSELLRAAQVRVAG
jgi:molecular chaperone GrpE